MPKTPSPCIDVCKFKRQGHCIGCSMTKPQKAMFKTLKKNSHRAGFFQMLMAQQKVMGNYSDWQVAYAKKCQRKGVKDPIISPE